MSSSGLRFTKGVADHGAAEPSLLKRHRWRSARNSSANTDSGGRWFDHTAGGITLLHTLQGPSLIFESLDDGAWLTNKYDSRPAGRRTHDSYDAIVAHVNG